MVVVAQLMAGDSLLGECQPLALYSPIYSKKMERRRVLEGYRDPYEGHIVRTADTSEPTELKYAALVSLPAGGTPHEQTGSKRNSAERSIYFALFHLFCPFFQKKYTSDTAALVGPT